jgi:hypothetical protein
VSVGEPVSFDPQTQKAWILLYDTDTIKLVKMLKPLAHVPYRAFATLDEVTNIITTVFKS